MQTEHKRDGADLDDFLESLRGDVNPEGVPGVPHVHGWVPPIATARLRNLAAGSHPPLALEWPRCGTCASCRQPWLNKVRGT